jgi:L-iditol 2-dehydrogenase
VVRPGDEAREALMTTGAQAYMPIVGPEVYSGGGFPAIYDCVGNKGSIEQSLRYAAARGRVVVLGCAAEIKKLDLTFLWARELHVEGYVGYGREEWEGRTLHTFEVTQELLLRTQLPVADMVTHVYPLAEYRGALVKAMDRGATKAIKVLLQP